MKYLSGIYTALIALIMLLTSSLHAQTYYLNNGFTSGQTVTTCAGNFYDSGGSGGNYANNQNYTVTFCSGTAQPIRLSFTAFVLESGYDFVKIYDGPTTAATALHSGSGFTGTTSPGVITSSGTCLTVQFTSDVSNVASGFAAAITCTATPACSCMRQVLYNTDFENGNTTGWTSGIVGGSGAAQLYIYTGGPTGNYVALNYNDANSGGGNYYLQQTWSNIIEGRTYTFSADIARHAAGTNAFMRAEFYNASNVLLSQSADQYATTLFPTFVPFSLSLVAPIGATYIKIIGYANGTALKIDNAKLITCFEPIVKFSNINNASFCSGGSASLVCTLTDPSVTVTYQWQSSTDGTTWADISGATTANYTASNILLSTYYRVKATPSGIGCSVVTSNPVRATVLATPSVNAGIDQTVCPNSSVTLTATATNADIFQINAISGNQYLEVIGSSTANGTNIQSSPPSNAANQKWRFIPIIGGAPITTIEAGRYYIQNMNSGLYLYPQDGNTVNSTNVEQGGTIGLTTLHQWDLVNVGGGTWEILNVAANRGLDIAAGAVILFDYSGTNSQKFYIEATAGNNYVYTWDNGLGTGATKIATPSVNTTYNVTVTDFEGCSAADATVVSMGGICAEVCNNNRDDDGDGFIDCADVDCNCQANIFPCDSKMYMIRSNPTDANNTNIEELTIIGGVPMLTTLFVKPFIFNALGYFNGYLYVMSATKDTLYRVDKLGNVVNLGKVANLPLPVTQWSGATCDRDGNFYIMEGTVSPNYRLYKIPLLPGGTYTATQIIGSLAGGAINIPSNPSDIAIDETGTLYAICSAPLGTLTPNSGLYIINLATGNATKVGTNSFMGQSLGSLFPADDGKMYGYGCINQAVAYNQNTFFEVNKTNGDITALTSTGTSVAASDGCSCPWRVTLQRSTTTTCTYPNATFNWDFTVKNQTGGVLNTITFSDTLDNRFAYNFNVAAMQTTLRAIYGNNTTITLSNQGGGTNNVVNIVGMDIPINSTNFSLSVVISATGVFTINEIVYEQAFLKNLPAFRGMFESSDYPVTTGPNNDPSPVTIYVPIIQIAAGGNSTTCVNTPINFTATNAGTGATYAWNFGANATPATGSTIGPIAVSYSTSGTKTITLTVTNNGCSANTTTTVTIIGAPTIANAGADQIACNNIFTMAANTPSVGTGLWTVVSGSATISNNLSPITTVTVTASPVTLRWTVSNTPCTASTDDVVLTVTPQITISSQPTGLTECVGGILTMSVTASGGVAPLIYQWQSSSNGTSGWGNVGTNSATFTPPSTVAGTLYYRVIISSAGAGCNNATSSNATVIIVDDPSVSATVPATNVCIGGGQTLSATLSGGVGCSIQWQNSTDNGATFNDISGGTGNSYITPSLSASIKYRAKLVCTGNGCCN